MARIHIGSAAPNIAESIAYGIFHLQGGELRVYKIGIGAPRMDSDCRAFADVIFPAKCSRPFVKLVSVECRYARQHKLDARGNPTPEANAVRIAQRCEKRDAPVLHAYARNAEPAQFISQDWLEPARAARKVFRLSPRHASASFRESNSLSHCISLATVGEVDKHRKTLALNRPFARILQRAKGNQSSNVCS